MKPSTNIPTPSDWIDIVFDGPPSHESGRFVEVENSKGASINFGEWIERSDGFWVLRIPAPSPSPVPTDDGLEMAAAHLLLDNTGVPRNYEKGLVYTLARRIELALKGNSLPSPVHEIAAMHLGYKPYPAANLLQSTTPPAVSPGRVDAGLREALEKTLAVLREESVVGRDHGVKCWIIPHDTLIELEKLIDNALSAPPSPEDDRVKK